MRQLRYAQRAAAIGKPHDIFGKEISFAGGLAYPPALPDLTNEALTALTAYRTETLQYGSTPGLLELRERLADLVAEDGVRVTSNNILIVNGAKQGLDLVCTVFVEPGDTVVVTSPTYMAAIGILRRHEVNFLEVPLDDEGLNVAFLDERLRDLERKGQPLPKLIYDVPDFHNPTATTMTRARREALVDLAERYGLLIVEDDPYRRLRFEGESVPSVKAFDRSGCVIGLGTFAKIVAPGLRVGWVTSTPEIVGKMGVLKSDGGSSPLNQRIILEYMKAGQLQEHARDLVKIYTERRDVMVRELAERLPRTTCRIPKGGYYLWLQLPEEWDADRIRPVAIRHGVRFYPASTFYATRGPANFMRLSYSFCTVEEVQEGVRRLAAAVAESSGGAS